MATEFTDTETASLQADLTSSLGAGVGVVKADVGSRIQSMQSQASQVLRKSIVQTTFKELYELEEGSLATRPLPPSREAPPVAGTGELTRRAAELVAGGWMVTPDVLERGRLFELEVELEADPTFRVTAVLSIMLQLMNENRELFQSQRFGQLAQAESMNRVLETLMVGLVPVRGRAVDFDVVELHGQEWIVHKKLLARTPGGQDLDRKPLVVVGVAQQSLFWKDVRLILFSSSRFRVFGRVAQAGLQGSWRPVKLGDVLSSVVPQVGTQLDLTSQGLIAAFDGATNIVGDAEEKKRVAMRAALIGYAMAYAAHFGKAITADDLAADELPSPDQCSAFETLAGRRGSFQAITIYLDFRFELVSDAFVAAQYRAAALLDAGMGLDGDVMNWAPTVHQVAHAEPGERYLDAEFVAVYW